MNLEIPASVLDLVKGDEKSDALRELNRGSFRGYESVDHLLLDPSEWDLLRDAADKIRNKSVLKDERDRRRARSLSTKLQSIINIRDGKIKKYRNLEHLTEAMRVWCRDNLPHGWIFQDDKTTNEPCPYLVTEIRYHPPEMRDGYYRAAFIRLDTLAIRRGKHVKPSAMIQRVNIGDGVDPATALTLMKFVPETEELVANHLTSCQHYAGMRQKYGIQLVASGLAVREEDDDEDSYFWRHQDKIIKLQGKDGRPGRVVLDDDEGWDDDELLYHHDPELHPQKMMQRLDQNDEEVESTKMVRLPELPYVRVYGMQTHQFCSTHVDNVDEYIYDRRSFDRVVLPQQNKDIIDAMVHSTRAGDDIVSGKGRGVIILSSGPPGTGKTLTAEAYSERSKRPLYSVQCSQLGLDPEKIEGALGTFLARCKKWNAIGLIDESDVFIRERGDDLMQNAIVGVFLRILEYYEGVLFMTTNRRGLVDDAVLSRCIIHVRYLLPTPEESERLWDIMLTQFKLSVWDREIDEPADRGSLRIRLVKEFEGISGRTIKQLCRLAVTMIENGRALNLETFRFVSQFQDLEKSAQKHRSKLDV